MNFWERVDEELKYSGKTRKELAQEADFDVSYISKGIARNGIPLADLALRISYALNVPLESLLEIYGGTQQYEQTQKQQLFAKYSSLLNNLEKMPRETQEKFTALAADFANYASKN